MKKAHHVPKKLGMYGTPYSEAFPMLSFWTSRNSSPTRKTKHDTYKRENWTGLRLLYNNTQGREGVQAPGARRKGAAPRKSAADTVMKETRAGRTSENLLHDEIQLNKGLIENKGSRNGEAVEKQQVSRTGSG